MNPFRAGANSKAAAVLAWSLLTLAAAPAMAGDAAMVSRLMQQRRYAEASQTLEPLLQKQPGEPGLRFLKGLLLSAQNRSSEAIAVFGKLTEDFPGMAEPYNNLAVLYAAEGQYEKAAAALEKALRISPDYVTARENLGDLYLKLAGAAFEKALQRNGYSPQTPDKLQGVRALLGEGRPATPQAQGPVASQLTGAEQTTIANTVHGWVAAWNNRDTDTYFDYYTPDFTSSAGEPRRIWEKKRSARLKLPIEFEVKIESLQIAGNPNEATVRFRQRYISENIRSDDTKILTLVRQRGRWLIRHESVVGKDGLGGAGYL